MQDREIRVPGRQIREMKNDPMLQPARKRVIDRDLYDAVLFDLDGVITNSANMHATCWKQMFDEYLRKRAEQSGEAFRPFDVETDYRLYVDGKPRFDGVRDFLASRGIQLPEGAPDDSAEMKTVCGLGNRKDNLVTHVLAEVGVEAYGSLTRPAMRMSNCKRTGYS